MRVGERVSAAADKREAALSRKRPGSSRPLAVCPLTVVASGMPLLMATTDVLVGVCTLALAEATFILAGIAVWQLIESGASPGQPRRASRSLRRRSGLSCAPN